MTNRRGFGSIRQRSSGRWQVRYKGPDGQYHTAPMTYADRRSAEVYLRTIEVDVTRQSWRAPATGTERLVDYGRRMIGQRPNLRAQTRLAYRADFDNHVVPGLGAKRVGTLTTGDIRSWHAELTSALADKAAIKTQRSTGSRRDGAATVARAYRILRSILNDAVLDGLLEKNPCQIKGVGNYKRPERPTLSPADVEQLANSVPSRYRVLVLILAWGGLRLGEATELRWRDVDLAAGTLRVERATYPVNGSYVVGDPKTEAGRRTVSLPAFLVAEIDTHGPDIRHPDALVVSTRSGTCAYGAAQTAITRTLRALGRTDVRVHDLRHTGHTLAAANGATLADLKQRLGHATVAASMTYAHAAGDHGRQVAERLDAHRAEVVDLSSRRTGSDR